MRATQAAIIGVGSSGIERKSDRGIVAFALDAAHAALADAGLTRSDIDGYVGAPSATLPGAVHVDGVDELSMRLLATQLGLERLKWGADLFWDFPTSMIVAASHALDAGACNTVLALRALYRIPDKPHAATERTHVLGEEQADAPLGLPPVGARFATRARAYLEASGATRRDLYDIVALARANAARNPLAIWRDKPVSLEEYLAAPMIAEPLCRFDCDMPVCAAVAFVITRADRARAGANRPVYLAGFANWQRPEVIFEASRRAHADVQLCQIYDGFSPMVYEWLERLGWCEPHTAWKFVRDGRCASDGPLPLNTFGGSLGEGRLHGAGHVREAVLQLSGRAGARQLANAENCLVQVGPHDFASLVMLSTTPG